MGLNKQIQQLNKPSWILRLLFRMTDNVFSFILPFFTKGFQDWFRNWKPIHLCWWFIKYGWKIPKYLIGAAIDIGQYFEATGNTSVDEYTIIALDNPANADGKITEVKLYLKDAASCKVGIFYEGDTGDFTCRSSVNLGSVSAGETTHSSLSLEVKTGDYIGIYIGTDGSIYLNQSGDGLRILAGDQTSTGEQTYIWYGGSGHLEMSLSGTGETTTEPTVTTQAVTSIDKTTATGNGNITDDGGATATRGMCWDTSSGPLITDSHATNGTGEGAYTVAMTGLDAGTKYYVRA